MEIKSIGIITSGGDCGGLNAVVKGASFMALRKNIKAYAIPNGYAGLYNLIDLDTLELQPQGADLVYQTGVDNYHFFTPIESVLLGVYGSLEPGLQDCQNAGMSSAPIAVESLSIDTYLCYRTDLGAAGRARLVAMDTTNFALTLDLLTWELP